MPLSGLASVIAPHETPLSQHQAKGLVIAVIVVVAAADWVTPAEYDVGVLYGLALAMCAWSRSVRFLWGATSTAIVLLTLALFWGSPPTMEAHSVGLNRVLTAISLLIISLLVQNWIGNINALERQQQTSRQLVAILDLAQIVIRSGSGAVLFWTRGAEGLYGWKREEALGRQTHEILRTEFSEGQLPVIREQLQRSEDWIGELRQFRKDDVPIWVASHWTLNRSAYDGAEVVIEVNNDVTDLKLAEDRFRNLTELLPHMIWQVSSEGKTTYVNRRWIEYFGQAPEDVLLTPNGMSRFVHPDDVQASIDRWKTAFSTGEIAPWEVRYRRHDGVYRCFAGRAVSIRNNAGTVIHWIGTATDVEDEKRVAHRLRESQKLEAIGRLAGGVAHDFNNLLTAITGYNSFLMTQLDPNSELGVYCREIENAADRAAALTKQLLTFSRPQLAQPQPASLNAIVRDISKILQRVIGEDVHLEIALSPELPSVVVDPVQIDQVVVNLAVNARDAMPDGGRLRIETGTAQLGESQASEHSVAPGEYVTLKVSDNGIGMDEATKTRLFEPFFTTKEKGKGTGLGLSIVFGIVKHSGGFITLQTALGAGAEFTIHLPASHGEPEDHVPAVKNAAPRSRGETVLVVEDEDLVRSLVQKVLQHQGYTVLAAATPSAAIKVATEYRKRIDLLLSDVLMPEMRGPELVSRIRRIRPQIAVLYMSGYTDSTFLDQDALSGASYIQKPFDPRRLAQLVGAILRQTEN